MRLRDLFLAAAAAACLAPAADASLAYAIGDGGASLLRFDTDNPGAVTVVGSFGGDATFLDGIDFRPSNGLLYGYLDSTDSVYTVDLSTAAVSFVSTLSVPTNTFFLGIDFNPVPDRLRIVTESQQNLRVNVATGATTNDSALIYAVGDPNENSDVRIIEAAYANSDTNPATGTQLYYIDYELDILATTSAPNDGILNTVGSLGVDTSELVGFDIFTANGGNTAYAILNVGGVAGFYTIDLSTGAATSVGALDSSLVGNIYGLSVVVPEPSSIALAATAGAFGLIAALRRRRDARS